MEEFGLLKIKKELQKIVNIAMEKDLLKGKN